MTIKNPNPPYWSSDEYYDREKRCIKASAPQKVKDDYEAHFNPGEVWKIMRLDYPNMKHPYKKWNGEVVDLGDEE